MERLGDLPTLGTHAEKTLSKRHGERTYGSVLIEAIQYFAVGENTDLPHAREVGIAAREATWAFELFFGRVWRCLSLQFRSPLGSVRNGTIPVTTENTHWGNYVFLPGICHQMSLPAEGTATAGSDCGAGGPNARLAGRLPPIRPAKELTITPNEGYIDSVI